MCLAPSEAVKIINDVGGCLRITLHHCEEKEINIINDVRSVHSSADWFCFARDVPRIMSGIQKLGERGVTELVIEKGIKFSVIHANKTA